MSEESDVEKSEEPTPQRRQKAREEGTIPRSKELTSWLMLLAGWALTFLAGVGAVRQLAQLLHDGLVFDRLLIADNTLLLRRAGALLSLTLAALLPMLLALYAVAVAASVAVGGLHLSAKSLKLDIKRLSPGAGLARLLSRQMVSELVKSVMKAALVGGACAWCFRHYRPQFVLLAQAPLAEGIGDAARLMARCLLAAIVALAPMVGYDVFFQLMSHLKKLRMSRQEIRDEMKQSEGDPQVKGRLKQLRHALARSRMMEQVPKADVIINNPTHYSVALRWQAGSMRAPVVLAKGAGEIAQRIRDKGAAHQIPMLQAAPLARALYRHCAIGDAIPAELYSVVAEVLAWVYRLRRWRSAGGRKPQQPINLSVPAALDFAHEHQQDG